MEHKDWEATRIGSMDFDVAWFKFGFFLGDNDFGWFCLPLLFLKEDSVFLLVTAMLKNFYLHVLEAIAPSAEGFDITSRLKRFVRRFISVPPSGFVPDGGIYT